MVAVKLATTNIERCIGCMLCVLASAREKGALSLNNSALKIKASGTSFSVEIDPGAEISSDVIKLCPRNCLSLLE